MEDASVFFLIALFVCGSCAYESFSVGNIGKGMLFLLGFIGLAVLWIIIERYNKRCPHCGEWGCLKYTHREVIERIPTTKIVKVKRNERYYETKADATKYIYHDQRICKKCGYQDFIEREEIKVHR